MRNLTYKSYSFPPGLIFIIGDNGQGKTNLVEAIYLLSALRSFRTSKVRELIKWGQSHLIIRGEFLPSYDSITVTVENIKKIKVNNKDISDIGSHFSRFPMILFTPQSLELIKGGPERRRRLLDRTLYQLIPGYVKLHSSYKSVLKSINLLLKKGETRQNKFYPYIGLLVQKSIELAEYRVELIDKLSIEVNQSFKELGGEGDVILKYITNTISNEQKYIEKINTQIMNKNSYITIGPQYDDINILLNGHKAKNYASQGQIRLLVISFILSQFEILSKKGIKPIVLLDDVLSELDEKRLDKMLSTWNLRNSQIFITGTKMPEIKTKNVSIYNVSNGVLTPVSQCV